MDSFYSKEGKYTFLDRTTHREEGGGYENWLIEFRDKKYYYTADVRIPGLVNSSYQPMPEKREKVIVVDFFSADSLNSFEDPYLSTGDSGYTARSIISCVADLTIRVIEPIRKFRYVAMCGNPEWERIHKLLARKLGTPAEPDIVKATFDILNPDLQKLIDMGHSHCIVGDLIVNPDWRRNNNLPPLD
jgi:hypothetical protein